MPSKAQLRQEWNNAGENVVVLHMFDRHKNCPNMSPFPLKLETYLKMADIKYVCDFTTPMSAKGKSPWITVNGKDVADSQLAIEYLAETLDKDVNKDLNASEKAVARSFRSLIEDHFYFVGLLDKWYYGSLKPILESFKNLPAPKFLHGLIVKQIRKRLVAQAHGQGIGRHSKEEVYKMGMQDMRAISEYLGDKPFMMGDTPTEIDCVLFGFTTMTIYVNEDEENIFKKAINEEFSNLKAHNDRMKEKYWPDWDDCLYKEPEKPDKKKKEEKKEDEKEEKAGEDKKEEAEKKDEKKKDEEEKKE